MTLSNPALVPAPAPASHPPNPNPTDPRPPSSPPPSAAPPHPAAAAPLHHHPHQHQHQYHHPPPHQPHPRSPASTVATASTSQSPSASHSSTTPTPNPSAATTPPKRVKFAPLPPSYKLSRRRSSIENPSKPPTPSFSSSSSTPTPASTSHSHSHSHSRSRSHTPSSSSSSSSCRSPRRSLLSRTRGREALDGLRFYLHSACNFHGDHLWRALSVLPVNALRALIAFVNALRRGVDTSALERDERVLNKHLGEALCMRRFPHELFISSSFDDDTDHNTWRKCARAAHAKRMRRLAEHHLTHFVARQLRIPLRILRDCPQRTREQRELDAFRDRIEKFCGKGSSVSVSVCGSSNSVGVDVGGDKKQRLVMGDLTAHENVCDNEREKENCSEPNSPGELGNKRLFHAYGIGSKSPLSAPTMGGVLREPIEMARSMDIDPNVNDDVEMNMEMEDITLPKATFDAGLERDSDGAMARVNGFLQREGEMLRMKQQQQHGRYISDTPTPTTRQHSQQRKHKTIQQPRQPPPPPPPPPPGGAFAATRPAATLPHALTNNNSFSSTTTGSSSSPYTGPNTFGNAAVPPPRRRYDAGSMQLHPHQQGISMPIPIPIPMQMPVPVPVPNPRSRSGSRSRLRPVPTQHVARSWTHHSLPSSGANMHMHMNMHTNMHTNMNTNMNMNVTGNVPLRPVQVQGQEQERGQGQGQGQGIGMTIRESASNPNLKALTSTGSRHAHGPGPVYGRGRNNHNAYAGQINPNVPAQRGRIEQEQERIQRHVQEHAQAQAQPVYPQPQVYPQAAGGAGMGVGRQGRQGQTWTAIAGPVRPMPTSSSLHHRQADENPIGNVTMTSTSASTGTGQIDRGLPRRSVATNGNGNGNINGNRDARQQQQQLHSMMNAGAPPPPPPLQQQRQAQQLQPRM